jgi:HEAT repeat protein
VSQRRFDLVQRTRISFRTGRGRGAERSILFALVLLLLVAFGASAQDLTALSKKLRSGSTEEKRDALMQLRSLRSEAASRAALPALRDGEPIVRATAASSVLFLPPQEAAAALVPLLRDKDEFVRREGASAIGETHDPSAASELIRSLTGDKSDEVRVAAAVALGKVGNPAAVSSLVVILDQQPNENNEMLRRAAARSIGQIAQIMRSGRVIVLSPQNFLSEKFKDSLARPSPEMLKHFTRAVSVLIRVLESSNEADDTRREAAFALGAIGDRSAESILKKYTSASDIYLAAIAKEALLKLKTDD